MDSQVSRLYLMHVASAPSFGNVPVVCYLVQTNDSKNILIDTGLPDKDQMPPDLQVDFGQGVVQQLASIGLTPDDIDTLICSHFDMDHCGHHPAFTRAKFVVQRAHHDHALTAQRFAHTRSRWDIPTERYQFVEGDTQLLSGVDLIATDGHTRGHQSVLVHLPQTGTVILAIDAIANQANCTPEVNAARMDEDEQALRVSTRKLLDLAEREQSSLIVFGHDKEQWETLKKLPEYYA